MKLPVTISIRSRAGKVREPLSINVPGSIEHFENGYYLNFPITDTEEPSTFITVCGDTVSLRHNGFEAAEFLLQKGKRYGGMYDSNFCTSYINVRTRSVQNTVKGMRGTLAFAFSIDAGGKKIDDFDMTCVISPAVMPS